MNYNIEIIRKNQHKTSEWSGGTTTQLYIYPVDSLYAERNFKWRLSSAKIDVESSTFTSLQGISRLIMVLEGELLLKHEGHHNAKLKALQQDSFCGEWATTSSGMVTDFNLMMVQGYKGKLEAISVKEGEIKHINLNEVEMGSQITEAFYILKGEIEIDSTLKGKISLSKGDLALVTRTEKDIIPEFKIRNCLQEEAKIIKASIFNKLF